MKLIEKLNEIRNTIKVDKEFNKAQGYSAFTIAKLNAELNPLLRKYKIGITCNVKDQQITPIEKDTNYGKKTNFLITGTAEYTLIDAESQEREITSIPFVGMNQAGDPSKSMGNAASYAYKYLWITLLGLTDATSDVDSSFYDGNNEAPPESPLDGALEEEMRSKDISFKDKGESKALCSRYEELFSKFSDMKPTAEAKKQLEKVLDDLKNDWDKLLNYEKQKLKKIKDQLVKDWEIG